MADIDLSSKSCLVCDHGTFVEVALRLAEEGGFGTVYYCDLTWQQAFSKIDHAVVGDGFKDDPRTPVIRVKEPWGLIDRGDVDVVVYPDVHRCEEQAHIEKLGIPVWGARSASMLETNKLRFKRIQQELGMPHAEYQVVIGLDELRRFCQNPDNDGRFIKMSPQFRGNKETFEHRNYEQSRQDLDQMGLEFECLGDVLKFLVEKKLKGKLEGGIDTYVVDGQHPSLVVSGWEKKDKAYLAEVVFWTDLPGQLREAVDPLFPILREHRCRQMLSTEVMIEDRVLLEPTIRFPSPAGEEQMLLYKNFAKIIYEGANGRLIEPEVGKRFACEAMIEHTGDENNGRSLQVPDSMRKWFKFYSICKVGKRLWLAPGCTVIGAVVGIGDSAQEAIEHLKENAKALEDQPVTIHTESLVDLVREAEEAKSKGLAFKSAPLPEPCAVLEET